MKRVLVASLVALASTTTAAADADVFSVAQVDTGVLVDEIPTASPQREASAGYGLGATVGYAFEGEQWFVGPEIGVASWWFGDRFRRNTLRVLGGGRFGLQGVITPVVYAHAGWGAAHGRNYDGLLSRSGFTIDAGAALDLQVVEQLHMGPQLAYDVLLADADSGLTSDHWVGFGAHAQLRF